MQSREARVITCSEYETLRVGELRSDQHGRAWVLTPEHLQALRRFADANKPRPFDVEADAIKFQQFVGIVCVGDLTLEILPKTDAKDSAPWRSALIQMLR